MHPDDHPPQFHRHHSGAWKYPQKPAKPGLGWSNVFWMATLGAGISLWLGLGYIAFRAYDWAVTYFASGPGMY